MKNCRFCGASLVYADKVIDLGSVPLANDFKATRELAQDAERYPLAMVKCPCGLHQLTVAVDKGTLFSDYAYQTPAMTSLLEHYHRVNAFTAYESGNVLEIGGNNGAFLSALGRCKLKINVEPAKNIAEHSDLGDAYERRVVNEFFTEDLAKRLVSEHGVFDLVVARHVLAHIDDTDEVLRGVRALMGDYSIFYVENAYAYDTMIDGQFDQLYHEHMSYLSVNALRPYFKKFGLVIADVDESGVHGGSLMLRVVADTHPESEIVHSIIRDERAYTMLGLEERFDEHSNTVILDLCMLLDKLREDGKKVDCYGATAKSTTLLNAVQNDGKPRTWYRGLNIRRCYDRAPLKISKFMPGTGIEIFPEEVMQRDRPDYCLITAWNYADEIMRRESWYQGRWIVPFPKPRVI